MDLFSPVKFDLSFDLAIEDKIGDLKLLLSSLFQETFLVQDVNLIDKEKLASIAPSSKSFS